MQQYIYQDHYRGKPRKLLILMPQDGLNYRVFCEADFLGVIKSILNDNGEVSWKTDYDVLKPIAGKIGEYIKSCTDQV